jgi:hypothetical protein
MRVLQIIVEKDREQEYFIYWIKRLVICRSKVELVLSFLNLFFTFRGSEFI